MVRRRPSTSDSSGPPPPGSARLTALRLLGRRDYTADELTRKLKDRGYLDTDVEKTLARLASEGLVNDRRAAQAHVRTASHVKARGPLRIRRELQARGVAPDLITEVTGQLTDDGVREAIDRFLVQRRIAQPVPLDQRRRLFQQLLRRGFPARLISAALKYRPDDMES